MSESADRIPSQPDKIELFRWDGRGPELEDNIASFTIKDPNKAGTTSNVYCIGYKFLGGDLQNPSNWVYDHTNYWDYDRAGHDDDSADPQLVSREKLDEILNEYGVTPNELLIQYCRKLKDLK